MHVRDTSYRSNFILNISQSEYNVHVCTQQYERECSCMLIDIHKYHYWYALYYNYAWASNSIQ